MEIHNILIADDDPDLGNILRDDLLAYGYNVRVVDNGADAIDQLKKNPYKLAIVDIRMPKVDGFGVLKFVKEQMPGVKIIMLTAYADLKHAVMSQDGGADDFMTKPYNIEVMHFTIQKLLANPGTGKKRPGS
jgi:two-component system response regulator PilR (NtrC family)